MKNSNVDWNESLDAREENSDYSNEVQQIMMLMMKNIEKMFVDDHDDNWVKKMRTTMMRMWIM